MEGLRQTVDHPQPPKPAPAKPAETARGGSDQPQAQQKKKASGGGKKKVANEGGEEKEKGPKRPTSSYFYFCAAKRPELKSGWGGWVDVGQPTWGEGLTETAWGRWEPGGGRPC